jgi:hypothetical protein
LRKLEEKLSMAINDVKKEWRDVLSLAEGSKLLDPGAIRPWDRVVVHGVGDIV